MSGKRSFGTVRRLASSRWQVRYTGQDGIRRLAPRTFETKRDGERWLVATEAEMLRGDWLDPDTGKVTLKEFAEKWVMERDLKARTREEYQRLLRLQVLQQLGHKAISDINPGRIRTWRTALLADGVGRSTVAKAYRMLHAIFATAVDDDMIRRNPCRIKDAGQATTEERPTVTLDQVFAIVRAIQPRYRLLVLLATFAQLRFGELVALRRRNVDLEAVEVRVRQATAEMEALASIPRTASRTRRRDPGQRRPEERGRQAQGQPSSRPTPRRQVPPSALCRTGQDGRLFIGPQGGIPRRRNFNRVEAGNR
jgi:integrase